MTASTTPRIIYVGGDVRSGTTILDLLLGMNPGTLAIGEVNLLFRQVVKTDPPVRCSCGQPLRDCPLWSKVLERFRAALPDVSFEQADAITRKMETYPARLIDAGHYREQYTRIWHVLFDAIAEVSGAACIIDSSKTGQKSLCRPMSLAEAGFDVKLLQMMRDPRAVAWSKLRREIDKGKLHGDFALFEAAFAAGLHWSLTNLSTGWLYSRAKLLPYCEMRYEDFMDDPVAGLRRIEAVFGLDLKRSREIVETDGIIEVGHSASGNEMRLDGPTHLRKQAPTWKTALPKAARLGVLISAPAAYLYHYPISDYRVP